MQITKFIPSSLTKIAGRQLLLMKKNSPNIMFGAGIVGVIAGTVLAARATLKVSAVLDDIERDIKSVDPDADEVVLGLNESRDPAHRRRHMAFIYMNGSYEIVKLYAPAVIVTGAAIAALTGSHVVLSRRNAGLTAAYAGLHKAYDEYRARIREEFGEQKELEVYHGVTTEKVKGEDGKLQEIKSVNPNNISPYAKFFDESSSCWEKDPEMNRMFIQCQQSYADDLLHARGHVFLNEVYDMLGLDHSSAGAVVGWIMNHDGDNYVSFNIFEASNSRFVNGSERSILLDFNVDGVIFDKLGR